MNDALRPDGLSRPQCTGFDKGNGIALLVEIIQQPKPGSTTAEDQDIEPMGSGHPCMLVDAVAARQARLQFGYPH